jgi:8-oxo-dGTP diphosphatase
LADKEYKAVEVAAAVIQDEQGAFLLAQRPEGKIWAGYWEFPGGKVEPKETAYDALNRELMEELGIRIVAAYPWITRIFDYPHARVRLNFFRVTEWKGELSPCEGQRFSWQRADEVKAHPLLPAKAPVVRALQLPHLYAISNALEMGTEAFLQSLQTRLDEGLKLIQMREKGMPKEAYFKLSQRAIAMAHERGAKVLINADIALARQFGADGVQMNASQLALCRERPDLELCAASCHNDKELRIAEELGCDFALLSPVLPTKSHPGAATLGWENFARIAQGSSIPVYALGGLDHHCMKTAWQHGAHGISLLRGAW